MSSEVVFFSEMVNELNRLIGNAMKKFCKGKLFKCELNFLNDISEEAKKLYIDKYKNAKISRKFYCFWKFFFTKKRRNYLDTNGGKKVFNNYPVAILDTDDIDYPEKFTFLINKNLLLTAYFNILKCNKNSIEIEKIDKTEKHIKSILSKDPFIRIDEILQHFEEIELT